MPGKKLAPLDIQLRNVKWGRYRLNKLFDIKTSKSIDEGKITLSNIQSPDTIEFVGRTRENNGIKGYGRLFLSGDKLYKNFDEIKDYAEQQIKSKNENLTQ